MKLSPLFEEALQFALAAHKNQLRKGTQVPYVSHLLAVASIVLDYGGDEDEAIAALLHDSVEDCGVDPEEIRTRFGDKATNIVVACTDSFEKNPSKKAPWRARKEAYLQHLETAPPPVLRVSAADKLHNARSIVKDYREIGDEVWNRFKVGGREALWYYEELVKIFSARGEHKWLVAELSRAVAELRNILNMA